MSVSLDTVRPRESAGGYVSTGTTNKKGAIMSYWSELAPNDSHKSFYGKARVYHADDGHRFLMSYQTVVAYIDPAGGFHRTWGGWSATTGRHLRAFSPDYKGAAAWRDMPVESKNAGVTRRW